MPLEFEVCDVRYCGDGDERNGHYGSVERLNRLVLFADAGIEGGQFHERFRDYGIERDAFDVRFGAFGFVQFPVFGLGGHGGLLIW